MASRPESTGEETIKECAHPLRIGEQFNEALTAGLHAVWDTGDTGTLLADCPFETETTL